MKYISLKGFPSVTVFHQRPASLFKIVPDDFVRGKRPKEVPLGTTGWQSKEQIT